MKNEQGQEVTQRECKGKYVDEECKIRNCKNAEYRCVIQEPNKKEVEQPIACRDHWKSSYEKLKKLLQGKENCKKCEGKGYTIFYDHKTYPVPHDEEYKFLCQCVQDEILLWQNEQP